MTQSTTGSAAGNGGPEPQALPPAPQAARAVQSRNAQRRAPAPQASAGMNERQRQPAPQAPRSE